MSGRTMITSTTDDRPRSSLPLKVDLVLQRKCVCDNHTIVGSEREECKKKQALARAPISHSEREVDGEGEVSPIVHEVLCSPGQPLDKNTRNSFEPRFGHDFSQVRVHADAKAAESARAVNALAYTVGRDIVFGEGQYAPATAAGKKLLVHELTHVIQKKNSDGKLQTLRFTELDAELDAAEQEAEEISTAIENDINQSMHTGTKMNDVRKHASVGNIQKQEPLKGSDPQQKRRKKKLSDNAMLDMPFVAHFVSKTQPDIQISGREDYNRCGKKLWDRSSVSAVLSETKKIMNKGFSISLSAEFNDLGCVRDAYIIQEVDSLKEWATREVIKKSNGKLEANKTHCFFIEGFIKGGKRDNTAGEVENIGGNLAAIINTGDRKDEGRTLAHEVGHTLDLWHPKDMGLAATSDPDYQTCEEGDYLMEWEGGTCVSKWERNAAREYGKEKRRTK